MNNRFSFCYQEEKREKVYGSKWWYYKERCFLFHVKGLNLLLTVLFIEESFSAFHGLHQIYLFKFFDNIGDWCTRDLYFENLFPFLFSKQKNKLFEYSKEWMLCCRTVHSFNITQPQKMCRRYFTGSQFFELYLKRSILAK